MSLKILLSFLATASAVTVLTAALPAAQAQTLAYKQSYDRLPTGLWKNNLDGGKIKAHPENVQVTEGCGPDGSKCLRVIYRHADGIHKQPASDPVFSTAHGVINWTPSDVGHSNTATDVTQANIMIDGSTDDAGQAGNSALPAKRYTLSYNLYFEPGFDFAKGGKLPGLAAQAFDSGCTEDGNVKRSGTNWSIRLMWRANGRVELYSYDQTRPSGSCGINRMIDQTAGDPPYEVPGQIPNDDKFRFQTGTWYNITLSAKLNDNQSVLYQKDADGNFVLDGVGDPIPLSGNGEISLHIQRADGALERWLVYRDVPLRDECNGPCPGTVPDSEATWVNAVFFSTFFGGNETKRLTCLHPALPSYPGLTQARYDQLCAPQRVPHIFPDLTWEPQTASAARFDNITVTATYVTAPSTDAQAPSAPANLTANAASSGQIDLRWTASSDNIGVTGYQIYRAGALVGSTSLSAYSDTGLRASTAYSYTVKASDAAGNLSAASPSAGATTLAGGGGGAGGAQVSAALAQDDAQQTKYDVSIKNTGSGALSGFSARIYVDLSEVLASGHGGGDVLCSERYNPSGTATCSLLQYSGNIYYANLNFGGYSLAPGAKIGYKITLHLSDWSKHWNSANDYSHAGLSGAATVTSAIPVYRGPTLISGTNPGGAVKDFTLSSATPAQTVSAGASASYRISASAWNGFADNVNLSIAGLPAGASGSFSPGAIGGGSGAAELTIATAGSTAPGSYALTVQGIDAADSGKSHSVDVGLVVSGGAGGTPHDGNFSPATLQFLRANTGLDGEQWDNIMKLVNKPEQDSLDWTKFYGYCENIGDQRGYTIGIFGATTGGPNDDGPDGPALFKEYDAVSGAGNPSVPGGLARIGVHGTMSGAILKITDSASFFCGKINGLQNNAHWREAIWRTFYNVYIGYSVQQARQRGFNTALTIGAFVDTALNQGASGDSGSLEGLLKKVGNIADEQAFMTKFYAERSKIVNTNDYNQPPNGTNRVKQWRTLLNQGETDLKNADAAVLSVTNWILK